MSETLQLVKESVFTSSFEVTKEGWYAFDVVYSAQSPRNMYGVELDRETLSAVFLPRESTRVTMVTIKLSAGMHSLKLFRREGDGVIEQVSIREAEQPVICPDTRLSNPKASANAQKLMQYLGSIYGKKMLTGQHSKDIPMKEVEFIHKITGQLPAVCGFELLGYSPNIQWETSDEPTVSEARNNLDTIKMAVDWAENKGGIVSYCWHWFSPMGGNHKAFYTEFTDFDAQKAVTPGTDEYAATIRDIDVISELLKVFAQKDIPILWRPLHEAEGGWFWWGAKGAEPCKKLWRMMYERMTEVHGLHNLIWVWNSLDPAWYPGDDCVDIVSADLYTTAGNYGSCKCDFDYARRLSSKMIALSECGVNPDPERAIKAGAPWLWQMTWCGGFVDAGAWNSIQQYKRMYQSPYAVTLEGLKSGN